MPLALINAARPPYDEIRAWFAEDATRHWAAYVAGVFAVLAGEHGVSFDQGAVVEIESDVPEGKGVSSSAALEAATVTALMAAPGTNPTRTRRTSRPAALREPMALLCQRAENLVVGAPCGVMDQMAVICGKAGPPDGAAVSAGRIARAAAAADGLAVFGIDSGIRHAVTGSDYTAVRVGAFMGYRILADLAGLAVDAGRARGPRRRGRPALGRIPRQRRHARPSTSTRPTSPTP